MIDYEILQDIITDHELCKVQENELAKVVELLKSGRLIELPCKVGDTVYVIRYGEEEPFIICEMKIAYFKWYEWGWFFAPNEPIPAFRTKEFGKTVFLTKEEAEAKLKKLNNE